MISSTMPVLVAGAGPTGLVAALTLLQNGVPVRIIDKEPQFRIGQRAHGIWPRTFDVFHFLHVHEIHQRSTRILPVREYKPGTLEPLRTFSMFTYDDPTPSVPYNNPMFLGQPALESIFRLHLEKYGCSVELGTELQSFKDDGERVLAKLVKKKDGQEVVETVEAAYLIGADGAKGVTRKQLGLSFLGETKKEIAFVIGDICVEVDGLDRDHWHFFGNRVTSFCMLSPTDLIAPDGFIFLILANEYSPEQLIADEKLLFKCISELIGQEVKVRKVVFLSEYRPNVRMVNKFGGGRVFIAGGKSTICLVLFLTYMSPDAAHVHSPSGAQGLNTCAQDALNLAWKVSLVYKGLSSATLLDSYNTERLPVIAEMLNITTGILHQMRVSPTIEGAMKREKRMNMLGVNYRASPIVVEEFTHAEPVEAYAELDEGVLVAGDRAPDAPGLVVVASGVQTRLFDVFSPTYHTVLVFTSDVSTTRDILELLQKHPRDVIRPVIVLPQGSGGVAVEKVDVVIDHGGHAYRAYLTAHGEQKVVVVRPDGVVGAIVHGAMGTSTYFDKIFI